MKQSKNYWLKREELKVKKGIKDCEKLNKELLKHYKKASKEIEKQINNLYTKYGENNQLTYTEASKRLSKIELANFKKELSEYMKEIDDPNVLAELNTLSAKASITRLEDLKFQCDQLINEISQQTLESTTELLTSTIEDTYNQDVFNISKGAGFLASFSGINKKAINAILAYPWSGSNYSTRIWNNSTQLKKVLHEEMTQMIIRGESSKKVAARVAKKMDSSYKSAIRLVQTEHAYAMNEASKYTYDELDIEKYEFLATLDSRSCKDCAKLDGQVFYRKDAKTGINYPPLHPNDRCTTVPYFEDDEIDVRFAKDKDGNRIEVPSDMSYEEWAKKYLDKNYKNDSKALEEAKKIEEERKAKEAEAKVKQEQEAKAKAEKEAKLKAEQESKAKEKAKTKESKKS